MTIEAMRRQILALRAQVDALAESLDALADEWPLPTEPTCPHLETEDRSTFGHPHIICKRCGQTVAEMPA